MPPSLGFNEKVQALGFRVLVLRFSIHSGFVGIGLRGLEIERSSLAQCCVLFWKAGQRKINLN